MRTRRCLACAGVWLRLVWGPPTAKRAVHQDGVGMWGGDCGWAAPGARRTGAWVAAGDMRGAASNAMGGVRLCMIRRLLQHSELWTCWRPRWHVWLFTRVVIYLPTPVAASTDVGGAGPRLLQGTPRPRSRHSQRISGTTGQGAPCGNTVHRASTARQRKH